MNSTYNTLAKHDWIKSLFYSAIIAGAIAAYSTVQSIFSVSGFHFTQQDFANIIASFGVSFGGCVVAFIKTNSQGHVLKPEPDVKPQEVVQENPKVQDASSTTI